MIDEKRIEEWKRDAMWVKRVGAQGSALEQQAARVAGVEIGPAIERLAAAAILLLAEREEVRVVLEATTRAGRMLRDELRSQTLLDEQLRAARLRRDNDMLALLRRVEWGYEGVCPDCSWASPAHRADCCLDAFLRGGA